MGLAGGVGLFALVAFSAHEMHRQTLITALLGPDAEAVGADPRLARFAADEAAPLYATHCEACHGADLKGDRTRGIPDLTDQDWLYGTGSVADLEHIVLYGIRAGNGKGWNLADMPAYARIVPYRHFAVDPLTPGDIRDTVEYLRVLEHRPADASAARRGAAIFGGRGACYDCHGPDGRGDSAIGAPNLADSVWLRGDGSRKAVFETIAQGSAGACPAWTGRLSAWQARALAVYVRRAVFAGVAVSDGDAAAAARRSTCLMALGAAVGIAIAGVGLFTAKGTTTHRVPVEDAALVNQRPILMTDFVAQAESTYALPFAQISTAQRAATLKAMIHEELYVQRGLELDFPGTDPDTRAALVAAVEQQAVADATTELPSDANLRAYYAEHRSNYATEGTMTVRDFRLRDPAQSTAVARALAGSADVAAAVRRYGLAELRGTQGEDFYFAAKIHLGATLFEAAVPLGDGAVSAPIRLPDGTHVLRMDENSPPVPRSFEQARAQVQSDYKQDSAARLRAADEKYLTDKAQIEIAPALQ